MGRTATNIYRPGMERDECLAGEEEGGSATCRCTCPLHTAAPQWLYQAS